jgi:hypothetical protein
LQGFLEKYRRCEARGKIFSKTAGLTLLIRPEHIIPLPYEMNNSMTRKGIVF